MLSHDDRATLLSTARASIAHGLTSGHAITITHVEQYSPALRRRASAFVTLRLTDTLRGCIGGLTAHQPLITDVAQHAFAAAFKDPRFPVLDRREFDAIHLEVSVLLPAEAVAFASESDLLAKLRPGIDGITVTQGRKRATFLPTVWETLPEPSQFLHELKSKARISKGAVNYSIERYETVSFGERD
ncbi:MAG: AmmeMemoRadiSam system protein A [Pseudomonadota bacterium]